MMRSMNAYVIPVMLTFIACVATASNAATVASLPSIDVSPARGAQAIRISGTVPGAHRLSAVLYADFSADTPDVLLSRTPLPVDGNGHFNAIISVAPAYFDGAVVTVIVKNEASIAVAHGSMTIVVPYVGATAPN
jgi:hypothetical protein